MTKHASGRPEPSHDLPFLICRLDKDGRLSWLCWLVICQDSRRARITFKVATLMHQALHRRCSAYLADLVAFSSTDSHRQLRSTTTRAAAIQRTRTLFGRRAFSVCGPDVWNSLPPSVRTVDSNSSFRRALKTHLFQLAFNN